MEERLGSRQILTLQRLLSLSPQELRRAWGSVVGEKMWPKVVYVLNRGGRYQAYAKAFDGEKFANKYGQLIDLYLEKYARSKSPMSGTFTSNRLASVWSTAS